MQQINCKLQTVSIHGMDQDPGTDETRANTHCCVPVQLGQCNSLSDVTGNICLKECPFVSQSVSQQMQNKGK